MNSDTVTLLLLLVEGSRLSQTMNQQNPYTDQVAPPFENCYGTSHLVCRIKPLWFYWLVV